VCQFRLSAYGLFGIFVRGIEVGEIDSHRQQGSNDQQSRGFQEGGDSFFTDGIYQFSNAKNDSRKQSIIGYLGMGGQNLECQANS